MRSTLTVVCLLTLVSAATGQEFGLSTSEKWMNIMDPDRIKNQDISLDYETFSALSTFELHAGELKASSNASTRSLQCTRDMNKIFRAAKFKLPWALKYMDSWAKRPSGLMQGNYKWYGDFDQCLANKPTEKFDVEFHPKFCIATLAPSTQGSLIKFGACVSENCDWQDLPAIVTPQIPKMLKVNARKSYCVDPQPEIGDKAVISISIYSVIGFFLVLGLVVDIIARVAKASNSKPTPVPPKEDVKKPDVENQTATPLPTAEMVVVVPPPPDFRPTAPNLYQPPQVPTEIVEKLPLPTDAGNTVVPPPPDYYLATQPAPEKAPAKPKPKPMTWQQKLLATFIAFSPLTNFEKMFKPPGKVQPGLNFSACNGIRTLSLFWVMLAHEFMFIRGGIENPRVQFTLPYRWTMQFVMAGIFAVDTFFFLSGFFGYFSMARVYKKGVSVFGFLLSLPKVYLLRYLRLTPPYAAVILISLGLWPHLWNGPFYYGYYDKNCENNWWTNLLYVNNFVDASLSHPCVSWSWYMPVDFQMYLVSPFAIYALVKWPIFGWAFCGAALAAQIVAAAVMTVDLNLASSLQPPMHVKLPGVTGNTFVNEFAMAVRANETEVTKKGSFFSDYYVKPYMRMGPFIVGIIFCHLLMQHEKLLRRIVFSRKWLQLIGWMLSIGLFAVLIYGSYGTYKEEDYYTNPSWANALFNAFARIAWGVALGWIVMACALNQGGFIGDFLGWPYWGIPARVSYCSYLINPMVLDFFVQTLRRPWHYDDINLIFNYVGTSFATLICAVLLSLAFESPTVGLLSLYLKG